MPGSEVQSRLGQMMAGHLASTRTYPFPSDTREVFQVPNRILLQSNFWHFDRQGREQYDVLLPPNMPSAQTVTNAPLDRFLPLRREVGVLYHEERLISVLIAIRGRTALPPVKYTMTPSGWRVQDGFHRYLASIIAGFPRIPTLQERPEPDTSKKPAAAAWVPRWKLKAQAEGKA